MSKARAFYKGRTQRSLVARTLALWHNSRSMEINYELTEKDFTESFATHRNRGLVTKWIRRIVIWSMVLVCLFFLVGSLLAHNTRTLMPMFAVLILWILILGGLPYRLTARRQFRKQPGAQGVRTLKLDATGAHWRWSGGSSDVEWKNYIRYIEGDNQILFYTSPACFNIVPKRAIVPEQLTEVREMLKQNIRTEQ